ncbi:sigma-54 dependent transcriptional regulator [Puniceibacterium sp. IMCC21224]|uniref:sigma-54-dependent transcriptional regulator n=1 Tax=Puniceibacterium sp. IMCC21224 TaxID=1618204 RepID=UPI00064D76ED|nr:sigma-54 dependent transcriptional regulator [Puniceibacterium sp. IMCC21224]KMK67102.1 response regulator [Puniceibacterium sp. IMCC21224]
MSRARIWVVDDDSDHRIGLCDLMDAAGYDPVGFESGQEALNALGGDRPQMILSDLRMPGLDGIAFLEALRGHDCDVPLVLLTGHGDVGQAVRAMQGGAQDFLEKPYDADHLLTVVARTLQLSRLEAENAILRQSLRMQHGDLLGTSTAITLVREKLTRIGPLDVDVIVQGETGTGKDLAARLLHRSGRRGNGPFVTVNCASLPETGTEADLFGKLRDDGSDVTGRIEQADGGTLFLDQIDDLPRGLQPKLLRLLQTRVVEPVGGGAPRGVDIRVIAASGTDLRDQIALGQFREDLFYRLAGVEITLPALREMPADIPELYAHFMQQAATRHDLTAPGLSFSERKALQRHHWPGNCHELRQAAQRQVLGLGGTGAVTAITQTGTLREKVEQFEALEIARVLDQCHGNTAAAAAQLGIPRRTLNAKIQRSGLRDRDAGPD